MNFIDPVKRNVAMVFQNYALYPHMTVFKNVAFPLQMAKQSKEDIRESVKRAATILGSTSCSIATRTSCPAASVSALRSRGRSCASRTHS